MKLLYAIRFLTILPIPYRENEDLKAVAQSTLFYPLTGLLLGAVLFTLQYFCSRIFSAPLTAVLVLVLWTAITGGLHLDGLSDLSDGLGGGRDREQRLAIMKDSRIGAFGVISLIIFLLLKWALILENDTGSSYRILLLAPMAARTEVLLAIMLFPPARKDGMGSFFKKYCSWREPLFGGLFTLAVSYLLLGLPGLLCSVIASAGALLVALSVSRKLGGLTGDVYGTTIELTELLCLFLWVLYNGIVQEF